MSPDSLLRPPGCLAGALLQATISITSRYDGTVEKLHWVPGDVIAVGANMVDIRLAQGEAPQAGGAEEPAPQAKAAPATPAAPAAAVTTAIPAASPKSGGAAVLAAPAVRAIAREHSVDLSLLVGTGKGGRIIKEDILRYLRGEAPAATAAAAPAAPSAVAAPAATPAAAAAPAAQDTVVPIRGYGRAMVKTMTAANAVPHFNFMDELRMDELAAVRASLKGSPLLGGAKLTALPLLLKALSVALLEHPRLNATANADCTEVVLRANHNIGVAMATPSGLVVPNVKGVQAKSIGEIAAELERLQRLAHDSALPPEDLTDGTITVSNVGTIGGTYAAPLLNLPEVAIVALGRTQALPRFGADGESVERHSLMPVSWSADHRVVDGASLASMSARWKHLVENPHELLASLK